MQINTALTQQFGLVSAAAFPPHATLIGNLRTDLPVPGLIARLDDALVGRPPFAVFNSGIKRVWGTYAYNINEDGHGEANVPFGELALAVREAVLPISIPVADFLVTPVLENTFQGHLSLASHDLRIDDTLSDEVGEYLDALPLAPPDRFVAEVVSLFEFTSQDWDGHWWETLRWKHLRSWKLGVQSKME